MKKNWIPVQKFLASDKDQELISLKLPKRDLNKLVDYPEVINTEIQCRLIKVILENGDTEVLCTSLTNIKKYDIGEFKSLYHLRWNEEEAYKLLKSRIEVENFSGKTAKAVRQDFYAKIFLMTLCAAYAHPIEEKVREEFKADNNRNHDQKINRTNVIATLSDMLIPVFIKRKITDFLFYFDKLIYKTREIIRKDRIVKRKKRQKKTYSMNYKKL